MNKNIKNNISINFEDLNSKVMTPPPDRELERFEEEIAKLKQEKRLRDEVKTFIFWIIGIIVGFSLIVFALDLGVRIIDQRSLYEEWFLISLLGSQVIILPFSLLLVVTQSLFPTNKSK